MKLNQFARLESDDCFKSEDVEDFYVTPIALKNINSRLLGACLSDVTPNTECFWLKLQLSYKKDNLD